MALFALALSGCRPEASPRTTVPSSSARARDDSCEHVLAALADEMAVVPAAEIRSSTPRDRLAGHMQRLERSGDRVLELRDEPALEPALAAEVDGFAVATAYLLATTAHLVGPMETDATELARLDRAADMAGRQRELFHRSARARCIDDGSRAQSPDWDRAVVATVLELGPEARACRLAEQRRFPGRAVGEVEIKAHLDESGRVELAGPIGLSVASSFSAELVACLVELVESTDFPRPRGRAIVLIPFTDA